MSPALHARQQVRQQRLVQVGAGFAGGVGPVFEEGGLQPAHRAALDAQVHVVVGVGPRARVFLVGDVDAAGEADAAVAHHDLAVGAVVGHRPQAPADARVVEQRDLDAGRMHRRHELAADALGAQRIEQQAHGDAGARALDQQVAQRGADAGRARRCSTRGGRGRARWRIASKIASKVRAPPDEQLDRGGARHRQAAGRRAQRRHLAQRRRRAVPRLRAAAPGRPAPGRWHGCAGASGAASSAAAARGSSR